MTEPSKLAKLNLPALYSNIPSNSIDVKALPITYPYIDSKTKQVKRANKAKYLYRYAKRYELNDYKYSIIMVSNETDIDKIEVFFDEQSKSVTETQAKTASEGDFAYVEELKTYYEETK